MNERSLRQETLNGRHMASIDWTSFLFALYRQIPTLKEYLVFWQDEAKIEQHNSACPRAIDIRRPN